MASNLEKHKKDLNNLITLGDNLLTIIKFECNQNIAREKITLTWFDENGKQQLITDTIPNIQKKYDSPVFPEFKDEYQLWYSESLSIVKFLLPDRLNDFIKFYEKPKSRKSSKDFTVENYVIADYLEGITVSNWQEIIIPLSAAIPKFQQQLNILKSVKSRFTSSLFDIKELLQAEIFDDELEAATELNKKGFMRGAGAMAGVVLERHLAQICMKHSVTTTKNLAINDYNELLKKNNIIQTQDWRFIQHLGDLRNLCDHNKKTEPTKEQVNDLISGVSKTSKTIY